MKLRFRATRRESSSPFLLLHPSRPKPPLLFSFLLLSLGFLGCYDAQHREAPLSPGVPPLSSRPPRRPPPPRSLVDASLRLLRFSFEEESSPRGRCSPKGRGFILSLRGRSSESTYEVEERRKEVKGRKSSRADLFSPSFLPFLPFFLSETIRSPRNSPLKLERPGRNGSLMESVGRAITSPKKP